MPIVLQPSSASWAAIAKREQVRGLMDEQREQYRENNRGMSLLTLYICVDINLH